MRNTFYLRVVFREIDLEFSREEERIFKKQTKKRFILVHPFWKMLTKKLQSFTARTPTKISIYWHQRRFRTSLNSVSQKRDPKIVQRGTFWVGMGSNLWVEAQLNSATGFSIFSKFLRSKQYFYQKRFVPFRRLLQFKCKRVIYLWFLRNSLRVWQLPIWSSSGKVNAPCKYSVYDAESVTRPMFVCITKLFHSIWGELVERAITQNFELNV